MKKMAINILVSFLCISLVGCRQIVNIESDNSQQTASAVNETVSAEMGESTPEATITAELSDDASLLQDVKENNSSALNYLSIVAEKITKSKGFQRMLGKICISLLSEINSGAIDRVTQNYQNVLLDTYRTLRNNALPYVIRTIKLVKHFTGLYKDLRMLQRQLNYQSKDFVIVNDGKL